MSKDKQQPPQQEQEGALFTPEQIKQIAIDTSTLKGKYQKYFLDHERLRYVYRLLDQCNLSTYLFQHETKELWPSLLVLTGMAAALIKPKKYTYKFIGVFTIATFHSVILQHYSCRRRIRDVALQRRFTAEQQEIRNLYPQAQMRYEYYYRDDPEIGKISALSQECMDFRRLKNQLNKIPV